MSFTIKNLVLPLSLTLLVASGCSSEEAEQGAKQIEQETIAAADATKEKTQEAASKVKQEMPSIIQNMKDTYKDSEKELKENTLQKGDSATVKKEAYLALSPEAYDELYQLIEINDLEGVENIEKDQQVIVINQDSEVEVIERDIRRTKVKMKDSGDEGYLPTSLLEPEK
jgi:hypothetical protein